jgi:hypothetical protein
MWSPRRAYAQRRKPFDVLTAVKSKVELLNATVLPKGVAIVPYYDRTWLIGKTLKTVFTNLVEGAMLVTLVLLLFLGNIRAAAIVAFVIPLSLLGTFLGLTWIGIPANLLSLGAMDFGIIVDGAVIVVENVFRKLSEGSEFHEDTVDERGKRRRLQAIIGRRRGSRQADAVLYADYHRGAYSHLHFAAARGADFCADGVLRDVCADCIADLFINAGAASMLHPAAQKAAAP